MKKTDTKDTLTPSQHIDKVIKDLPDWRGKLLSRLRKLIHEASPELTEDWKWDTPVFACKVEAGQVFLDADELATLALDLAAPLAGPCRHATA